MSTAAPSRVNRPTRDELMRRREALLRRTGRSMGELEAEAERGTLSAEEFWLLSDIR